MSAPEATRRLFVASWPDEATRSAVMRVAREALAAAGGRRVDPAGLHVTLAFLGSVGAGRVPEVLAVLGTVRADPFEYCFDRLASWPGPRVLALTQHDAPPAALQLVERLWTALEPLGFVAEQRRHRPHVTLARKLTGPPIRQEIPPLVWPVRDIFLVESRSAPDGSVYEPLAAHELRR
jgi:2'-5' RNA ligase